MHKACELVDRYPHEISGEESFFFKFFTKYMLQYFFLFDLAGPFFFLPFTTPYIM